MAERVRGDPFYLLNAGVFGVALRGGAPLRRGYVLDQVEDGDWELTRTWQEAEDWLT